MFKLTIITINFNNLDGLKKTVESVLNQTSKEFEYVLIDGGSTDGSKEFIESLANNQTDSRIKWISELDNGIYHAMNKGIKMAQGEFVQFINSGDILVDNYVTEKMLSEVAENDQILYGHMLKQLPKGLFRDKAFAGRKPTFIDFYYGTLNHSPSLIRKTLFEKFGYYDEKLKIVADWKWYLQVIILFNTPVRYLPIDVTRFDMNGISNSNRQLEILERNQVLTELIPLNILEDYTQYAAGIDFFQRLKKIPTGLIVFNIINRIYSWIERKTHNNYIK